MKHLSILLFHCFILSNISAQTWTKIHDLGRDVSGFEIDALSDGNYLVSGKEWGFDNYAAKYLFTKINIDGDVLWNKAYSMGNGGGSYSNIYTFPLPQNQGFYVVGSTYGLVSTTSYGDIFILRLNEQGDSLWSKTIGTENIEFLYGAFMTAEQQFVFLYSSHNTSLSNDRYYLSKVDINGEMIWNHELPIVVNSVFYSLIPTPDGNFIAAGFQNTPTNQHDALAVKIDPAGNILWKKTYGGNQEDFFFDLEVNKNGNPLFFGTTGSNPIGFYIVETDWEGTILSQKNIPLSNGSGFSSPHPGMEVLKLHNNGFLITVDGHIGSCGDDDSQLYWLDSDANYSSNTMYGTPGKYETLYNAIQLPDESILSVGGFLDSGETDLLLVKFENGLFSNTNPLNLETEALTVYPNPFNQVLQLDVPSTIELPVLVEIYDINGRALYSETITQYPVQIEPGRLGKGMFILKLHAKNWVRTAKIVRN